VSYRPGHQVFGAQHVGATSFSVYNALAADQLTHVLANAGAIVGGITADLWGLHAAIWTAAAITLLSGVGVAARMYETHPRPNQRDPGPV